MDLVDLGVNLVDDRNQEGPRFPCSVLGSSNNALPLHDEGDGFFLDGRGFLELQVPHAEDQILLEVELVEGMELPGFDVLSKRGDTLVCSLTSLATMSS